MARPRKLSAEWFPHDVTMHQDTRIRALIHVHGLVGYAVWNLILETIAAADGFVAQLEAEERATMAEDWGIEQDILDHIIRYLATKGLLHIRKARGAGSWEIRCDRLEERLEPMMAKRKAERRRRARADGRDSNVEQKLPISGVCGRDNPVCGRDNPEMSDNQVCGRDNPVCVRDNPHQEGVSAAEMPQKRREYTYDYDDDSTTSSSRERAAETTAGAVHGGSGRRLVGDEPPGEGDPPW